MRGRAFIARWDRHSAGRIWQRGLAVADIDYRQLLDLTCGKYGRREPLRAV